MCASVSPIRRHRSAKHNGIDERRAVNVLNDVGKARPNEDFANGFYETGPVMRVPVSLRQIGIRLTWRRCVNGVKRYDERWVERKRISLNERQRVMRLGINIYPDNLESCPAVADARAARTAEEVE